MTFVAVPRNSVNQITIVGHNAAGWASTLHTHTHLQRSWASTVSTLNIALLLPAPTAQGRAGMPYSTLLPLPILLYRPDLPFLLPTPMSPLTRPYCHLLPPPQIPPLPPTLARTSQSLSIYFNAKTTFRTFFKQAIKQLKHKQSVEYVKSVKR